MRRGSERGQILVIFAVGLLAIVAMVGLVLDGGSAWAQRRSQQNASDLAALAGANTYLLTQNETTARAAALEVATSNGWEDGVDDVEVDVSFDYSNGVAATVLVNAEHDNAFGAIMNMRTWDVATTATAQAGIPDSVVGSAPMIFSVDAFDSDGVPYPQYGDPENPYGFGDTNNHAPDTPGDFAWTNFGTGNVNSNQVKSILEGNLVITKTINFGDYIGQHNNGNHTTLFDNNNSCEHQGTVNKCLSGKTVPVPVVDHNGNFMGWASFHVTSASGGSTKKVFGYFVDGFVSQQLSVGSCSAADGSCPRYFGSWTLKLID